MSGNRRAAIKKLRNLVITPKGSVDDYRSSLEQTFATVFLPNNVHKEEQVLGGVSTDIFLPELFSADKVILYVHGGCFAGGTSESYCKFCSLLASNTSCRVFFPKYRLPPTYPFPSSIEDTLSAFNDLVRKEHKNVIVAADSSGASIAIALILKLSEVERRSISNLVLFSPWLDFSSDTELIKNKKLHDEILSGANLHRAVDLYTYSTNFSNPLISPLKADDECFEFFPQVFIQLGENEIIMKQVRQFEEKLKRQGVSVEVDVWKNMMFMFQMAEEYFTESHLALQKVSEYINWREEPLDFDMIEERNRILRKNDIQVD